MVSAVAVVPAAMAREVLIAEACFSPSSESSVVTP